MKSTELTPLLEIRIKILADKIVEQSSAFDKMQNKMFAIVGLLLTLGGLLTYDAFKINFPDSVVEYIIFIVALTLLGFTTLLIGYDYKARKTWSVPIGPVEEVKLDDAKTFDEALKVIHEDYLVVYHDRGCTLDHKARVLNATLYMFITSVILLIVLKIGG